jgi:CheY-like chemotaxis protein
MPAHRYLLLVSPSTELTRVLQERLLQAGISEPLLAVPTDTAAVAKVNDPDHEPPIAVFVDVAQVPDSPRLIGWIVSSPTTNLVPVFAIVGANGPQAADVEPYRPTAIISKPLSLDALTSCIKQCPLLLPRPGLQPQPGARRVCRVVVVDDSDDDVQLLLRAVTQTEVPWTILAVLRNGEEAIRYFEKLAPSKSTVPAPEILLLDLKMPRLGGFEVLEWMSANLHSHIVTVVFSTSPQPADMQRAHDLGAHRYIVKPSTFEELLLVVQRLNGLFCAGSDNGYARMLHA